MRSFILQRETQFKQADQLEISVPGNELTRARVIRMFAVIALVVWFFANPISVSYTHLTLPTNREV